MLIHAKPLQLDFTEPSAKAPPPTGGMETLARAHFLDEVTKNGAPYEPREMDVH